jgi:sec-independent protein translocase protein TatB
MFDIGGWEFLIVIVIAIIVIGPKDLPGTIRTVSGWIRRARELAREFQSGLDDLANETDLDNVKNDIQSGLGLDDISDTGNTIRNKIENTIDPDGNISDALKEDYSEIEEDGPFADNSFEEDEDIDGADIAETKDMENSISDPADLEKFANAEVTDNDELDRQEEIPSQAVNKADS